MNILQNVKRLFRPHQHTGMVERGADDFFVIQTLREKKARAQQHQKKHAELAVAREHIKRAYERYGVACDELESELIVTPGKNKTRLLMSRLSGLLKHRQELGHHLTTVDRLLEQNNVALEHQRVQHEQFETAARSYFYSPETDGGLAGRPRA